MKSLPSRNGKEEKSIKYIETSQSGLEISDCCFTPKEMTTCNTDKTNKHGVQKLKNKQIFRERYNHASYALVC